MYFSYLMGGKNRKPEGKFYQVLCRNLFLKQSKCMLGKIRAMVNHQYYMYEV